MTGVLRTPDVRFENLPDHPFAPNDVEVQTRNLTVAQTLPDRVTTTGAAHFRQSNGAEELGDVIGEFVAHNTSAAG